MAPAFKSDLNDIIDTEENWNRLAEFRTAFGYSLTAKIPFVPVPDEDGAHQFSFYHFGWPLHHDNVLGAA